jgi:hypothetical protein
VRVWGMVRPFTVDNPLLVSKCLLKIVSKKTHCTVDISFWFYPLSIVAILFALAVIDGCYSQFARH